MTEKVCDYCGEPIEGSPIKQGERVYCSEACAFEANRSQDCAGRSDSVMSQSAVEPKEQ